MTVLDAMQRALAACLFALVLSSCGGGGGGSGSGNGNPPAGGAAQTIATTVVSAQTGMTYDLQIYLPPGYSAGTTRLPVIYAMDGQDRYTRLIGIIENQRYDNVIVVAIGAISSSRRFVDFTMPGAQAYYRFLTFELIPIIDARYRTDPANRILSGHSLSAEFALFALYLEPPGGRYFASFLPADCTCWAEASGTLSPQWDVPATMEQQMFDRTRLLPVKLAMSGDSMGNLVRATDVYQKLSARGYVGLGLQFDAFNLGHVPMDGPAFAQALPFVLGPSPH